MKYTEIEYKRFGEKTIQHAPLSQVLKDEKDNLNHFLTFDSIGHLVDCVDSNTKSGLFEPEEVRKSSWTFGAIFKDMEKSRRHLIEGSVPEGLLDRVEELKQELFAAHPELLEFEKRARKMKRKKSFSEDGGELNIDRFMSGEPEYWQRSIKQPKKNVVKLFINYAVGAATDTEVFTKNVIAAVVIVDILRSANVSSEVWIGALGRRQKHRLHLTGVFCKLKSANDPVDFSRLLSCSAPALFRYWTFSAWLNLLAGSHMTDGYGNVLDNHEAKEIRDYFEFDAMLHLQATEQSTFQIITDTLIKILS